MTGLTTAAASAAQDRMADHRARTPPLPRVQLSATLEEEVWVKAENLQHTAARSLGLPTIVCMPASARAEKRVTSG
ncbi:MAG TPA: hypothetical protein VI248_14395 [Kineosporiaceae bacterium]